MIISVRPVQVTMMRCVKVTVGLVAFGAVSGAIAGASSAVIVGAVINLSFVQLFDWFLLIIGAEIGAPLGAVLFPVAAWTLMRHVPFGRAIAGTMVGAFVGGFIGWFITPGTLYLPRSIMGGIIGFAVAAVLLRLRARAARDVGADGV